ncbi:synaptogenesis protein syg-2-like [Crassostrea angulata]|uniref:synaptogenesis protein syg-2-like n=1 Tax=Magallana angulata TaxID=2784310 RepID=UPI0022B1AF98|nr:synaptogenesis protein syg-2-like [Crassostrea angulata]
MDSNFHISHTIGQFDLIKTTSVFMYTGVKNDNMQNVFCKASNWPGVTVESVSYSLNVRYPPPAIPPRITSSPSGFQYDNGTNVTLTCQQSGGNPVSTLSWNCKNTEMSSKNMSNSTEAISVLELTIDVSFNEQECTCTANHTLFSKPLSAKKLLTVFRK